MILCKCGCGEEVTKRRRLYIDGHLIPWNKNKKNVYSNKAISKMSEARKKYIGINHPMYGKHHSEKTKKLISNANTGKPSKLKGCKCSEEHIRKNSQSHTKEKHNLWGKHRSEQTKKRISEGNKGKIISEETRKKYLYHVNILNTQKKQKNVYPRRYVVEIILCLENHHFDTLKDIIINHHYKVRFVYVILMN